MSLKSEKFKVGIFIVVNGVLLLSFLAFAMGKSLFRTQREYTIRFEETVKGLASGAQVNYHGVPVGSVGEMRLDGNTTVVKISLDPSLGMIQDGVTRAALERNPVTGMATVELEGWEKGKPELPDGCEIPADPSWGSKLMMDFPKLMDEVPTTLKAISEAALAIKGLLGDDLRDRLLSVLTNLDTLSARLPQAVEGLEKEGLLTLQTMKRTVDELSLVLTDLNQNVANLSKDAQVTMADARSALQAGRKLLSGPETKEAVVAIRDAAVGLEATMNRMGGVIQGLETTVDGTGRELGPLLAQLTRAAAEMSKLATLLSNNPSALIWADPRPERKIPDPGIETGRRDNTRAK